MTRVLRWSGRRRMATALGATFLLVTSSMGSTAAVGASSLPGSNFEIDDDANLRIDGAGSSIDWLDGTGTALRAGVVATADQLSGSYDDAFGQGAKEDSEVPAVVQGGIPPNKSDLKTFGVYKEAEGAKSFLHVFWARVQDPSGTTNMDFEFNQKRPAPGEGNGITPLRTPGDRLFTYDLSNGGTKATIMMRIWDGSSWGPAIPLAGALGTINTTAIPAGESGGLGPLGIRTFGEASIDLSTLFRPGDCLSFGSAYLKSRSSDSFTSALKDFIAPEDISLSNCGGISITKQDDAGTLLDGAVFTLYHDESPLGPPRGDEDQGAVDDPNRDGIQDWTCTTVAGVCSFSDVPIGQYWVEETGVPENHVGADDQHAEVAAADTVVELTFVNARQPGTITVHKQDDADDPATVAVEGSPLEGVGFSLYVDAEPIGGSWRAEDTTVAGTCTTDSSGDCSFPDVPLGSYWVVETGPPSGYGPADPQLVVLETAAQSVPLTFVDARQFKVIVLVCQEGTSQLYASNVRFDGAATPTGNNSLGTPQTSPSNAELCGLGGATLSGVGTGAHSAAITIPPVSP
ncbi:MAG TPA: SpaA isopeptide-forming pilin-related protein [Acidimicrobiia bacterium]|nr:SpaA isopeptide-forming pilin-related protein [Acidimicrobiia bacterium]